MTVFLRSPSRSRLADDFADLGVDVADASVIAADGFALFCLGNRAFLGNAFIAAELASLVARERGSPGGQLLVLSQANVGVLVHVPIFFRSDPRHVRFVETDGEEERLVLDFVQRAYGLVGDLAIEEFVIGHVARLVREHVRARLEGFGAHRSLPRLSTVRLGDCLALRIDRRVVFCRRFVVLRPLPGLRAPGIVVFVVAVRDMKDLADAAGFVAVVLKQLRQGHDIWHMCTNERFQVENLDRLRPPARQERCTRRIAERELAICTIKLQTLRGKRVDVRRLDLRMAVAAELGPQVVDGDEENIESRL